MRLLFSSTGGVGHLRPLLPFAHAARDAGHDVLLMCPESFTPYAGQHGLRVVPFADADPQALGEIFAGLSLDDLDGSNATVIREVFGRLDATAATPAVQHTVEAWQPDLVVHESTEFAAPLVAEQRGIPRARVAVGLPQLEGRVGESAAPGLADLRATLGLAPDPHGLALRESAVLSLFPPLLDGPAGDVEATHRFREDATSGTATTAAETPEDVDWGAHASLPLVYVSLGSVAGAMPPFAGVFAEAIAALADLEARVLVAVGPQGNTEPPDGTPDTVRITRWVDQHAVLQEADLFVTHAGAGSVREGLTAGVPLVLVPLFADQPYNAARVAEIGAGVLVGPGPDLGPRLFRAVEDLRSDPSYRAAARRVAEQAAALPPVADAVPLFEALADTEEHRP